MKKTGRKLLSLLLASLMVAALLPTFAFAYFEDGTYTRETLNACMNESIKKVNESIKDFAVIGEVTNDAGDAYKSNATIYVVKKDKECIADARNPWGDPRVAIVGGILEEIYLASKGKGAIDKFVVQKFGSIPTCKGPGTCLDSDGNLPLSSLNGNRDSDAVAFVSFCINLGIAGSDKKTLGEYDGMSFSFGIKAPSTGLTDGPPPAFMESGGVSSDKSQEIAYTFTFKNLDVGEDVLGSEHEGIEFSGEPGTETLTGSGLRNGASGKKVEDIFAMLTSKDGWSVVTADEEPVETTEPVGTGYVLKHTVNGVIVEEITIVVPGDVSNGNEIQGDGKISVLDCSFMVDDILGNKSLEGIYENAADVVVDGIINVLDIAEVVDMILGKV